MKISSLLFLSENVHFSRISAQEEKKEILPLLWFNLLIGLYCLKIANFSENLGTEKTTMSQLISPKSSSVTSPPPPPVIKSHILISLCYQWVSREKKSRERKVLFWKVNGFTSNSFNN